MGPNHPGTELIAYLRGELPRQERDRVSSHLEKCANCQQAVRSFRRLLDDLAHSAPRPPAIDWGHFQAELRAKLEQRSRRGLSEQPRVWRPRWAWAIPLTISAAVAGIFMLLEEKPRIREPAPTENLTALEETVIGGELDFLRQYALVERLDLLENFEVIRALDRLPPARGG